VEGEQYTRHVASVEEAIILVSHLVLFHLIVQLRVISTVPHLHNVRMRMNGRQQMEQPHARISRKVKVLFVVLIFNGLVRTRIAAKLNLRLVAFVVGGITF
jgi:hypothetical protein